MEWTTNDADPVIVMGMHRSGTTMLSRLLQEMDVHLGADLCRETLESFSFMRLNNKLLYKENASWHDPMPMWKVLKNDESLELAAADLRGRLSRRSVATFWGDENSLRTSSPLWGWKDPRNTLTLPIWRRVFPDAKIIYLLRNGVDVAWSLVKRDRQLFRSSLRVTLKKRLVHLFPRRWPEFKPRPFMMEDAFQLWTEYLRLADFNTKDLPDAKILRLRYEDLLIEPLASLHQIAEFVAADSSDRALRESAGHMDTHRRFAFVTDTGLCDFYRQHCQNPEMVHHGYDRILDVE